MVSTISGCVVVINDSTLFSTRSVDLLTASMSLEMLLIDSRTTGAVLFTSLDSDVANCLPASNAVVMLPSLAVSAEVLRKVVCSSCCDAESCVSRLSTLMGST